MLRYIPENKISVTNIADYMRIFISFRKKKKPTLQNSFLRCCVFTKRMNVFILLFCPLQKSCGYEQIPLQSHIMIYFSFSK